MVLEIITYPSALGVEYATDVRTFNETLLSLIQDLKDTVEVNNLQALSAFQIGSCFNVIVVKKEDGSFLELINPRIINTKDKITTIEKTAYFPGLSAEVTRYAQISLVYQDKKGNQHSLKADGEFSITIQRKIDYTFGATFLSKLSKEEKAKFEKKLEFGVDVSIAESCPTTFKRDYLVKTANILFVIMVLVLLSSLFIDDAELLSGMWKSQIFLALGGVLVNIFYFFYAHYEAKQYTTCVSCQSGNIIGTALISLVKFIFVTIVSYFVIA